MNVPWPNVSRLVRSGAWDSSDRSGPWMTLPAAFEAVDRRDAGVDQRDVDALARVAGGPPGLRAGVAVVMTIEFDVARRVVPSGAVTPVGAEGRGEQEGGQTVAPKRPAREVEAPATCRHRTVRVGAALQLGPVQGRSLGCTIEVHLQEGSLMRRLVTGRSCRWSRKIPGFASPPLGGFALFQTGSCDSRPGCRRFSDHTALPGVEPNGTKVPVGASRHRKCSPAARRERSAGLDDRAQAACPVLQRRQVHDPGRVARPGRSTLAAARTATRVVRRERPREVVALGATAAQLPQASRAGTAPRRPRRSPSAGGRGPSTRWHSRAPSCRRRASSTATKSRAILIAVAGKRWR